MEHDADTAPDRFEDIEEGINQWVHVKLPQMPPDEMEKATPEIMAVAENIAELIQSGVVGSPAVLVVIDERYPQLPALEELEDYAAVFTRDRADPPGLVKQRR